MEQEKCKKASAVAVSAVFLAMLLAFGVMTCLGFDEDHSFFENRSLATMPSLTLEGVLDGSYFTAVGEFIKDHAAARDELIAANTVIDIKLLRRPVVNGIYVGDEVLLPYFDHETVDKNEIASTAERVAEDVKTTADLTASYGGSFYYTAIPCQYMCYGDSYPWYLNSRVEYLAESASALFSAFDEKDISYVDMMELYEEAGRPAYFSSTVDHHYGVLGAYSTYREILRRYSEDTGAVLDVLDEDEMTVETLPNRYIGSRSRKLFGLWDSDEHLQTITPVKSVPFARYNNGVRVGDSVFSLPENDEDDVLYTTFMGGDVAHALIDTDREELPTVLIYGESFTNAMESFMWYSFDEMHSIDPRYYKDKTVDELIAELQPDLVVCVRDYSVLLREEWSE